MTPKLPLSDLDRHSQIAKYFRWFNLLGGLITNEEKDELVECVAALPVSRSLDVEVTKMDGSTLTLKHSVRDTIRALKENITKVVGVATNNQRLLQTSCDDQHKVLEDTIQLQSMLTTMIMKNPTADFSTAVIRIPLVVQSRENILISFGPQKEGIPETYLIDEGNTFGDRGGGMIFGWNMDTCDGERERGL